MSLRPFLIQVSSLLHFLGVSPSLLPLMYRPPIQLFYFPTVPFRVSFLFLFWHLSVTSFLACPPFTSILLCSLPPGPRLKLSIPFSSRFFPFALSDFRALINYHNYFLIQFFWLCLCFTSPSHLLVPLATNFFSISIIFSARAKELILLSLFRKGKTWPEIH